MKKIITIDTEFTDFINTQLISLGAVVENQIAQEFYVEILDYNKKASSAFVKAVVEPQLNQNKFGKLRSKAKIAFRKWLDALPKEFQYSIAIDYLGDWELMLELYEGKLPAHIDPSPIFIFTELDALAKAKAIERSLPDCSWFCSTVQQKFYEGFNGHFKVNPFPEQHHALADAKANLRGWNNAISFINEHY